MSTVPYSNAELAESAAKFAESIAPPKERWSYCFARSTFAYDSPRYGRTVLFNERTLPVCDHIVGGYPNGARFRLQKIKSLGLDGAFEWDAGRRPICGRNWFYVGPMQAWNVGHLYFARVVSHPHIVKVGFSRRVRDRLDDIESKVRAKLELWPGEIRVGTLADEHWWHKNWERFNISGEWFFDPHMSDRTLPTFLTKKEAEAA